MQSGVGWIRSGAVQVGVGGCRPPLGSSWVCRVPGGHQSPWSCWFCPAQALLLMSTVPVAPKEIPICGPAAKRGILLSVGAWFAPWGGQRTPSCWHCWPRPLPGPGQPTRSRVQALTLCFSSRFLAVSSPHRFGSNPLPWSNVVLVQALHGTSEAAAL